MVVWTMITWKDPTPAFHLKIERRFWPPSSLLFLVGGDPLERPRILTSGAEDSPPLRLRRSGTQQPLRSLFLQSEGPAGQEEA